MVVEASLYAENISETTLFVKSSRALVLERQPKVLSRGGEKGRNVGRLLNTPRSVPPSKLGWNGAKTYCPLYSDESCG
ncbi:hypothetical protein TNCV_2438691 [Trichonephila clavipes]|nr:hypothetical protein TNCV_2438691 [Trichonephila clavipes]